MSTPGFIITPRMQVLLKDIGVHPVNVLRRAGLPDDMFNREKVILSTPEWFQLWNGLEEEAANPLLPLIIGQAITFEAFDPLLFAAMCSPDLATALERIRLYKKLCAPLELRLERSDSGIRLEIRWMDTSLAPPAMTVLTELIFFVQLARLGTREMVYPRKVISPVVPDEDEYTRYFGVYIECGEHPALVFSACDAKRPFLTSNPAMWHYFEPDLRKRMSELDSNATTSERVHAALLELLPSGTASLEVICEKLGMSKRTLQRRLKESNETYQSVLNETRTKLASHYLNNSALSATEISFLLGFEDPNSFFRAIQSWTGKTARQTRESLV